MKIRVEHNMGDAVQFEVSDDLDIHCMMDVVERMLIELTYHPDVVKEGFIEKAYDIENE